MSDFSHNPKSQAGATAEVGNEKSGVRGTVRVAPTVLIELVELTVQNIAGVAGLRSHRFKDENPPQEGARTFDNGKIAVTVAGDQIDVAIAFAIHQGTNVSELSTDIQKQIGFAVGNMLGMTVQSVDIYIEEIIAGPSSS